MSQSNFTHQNDTLNDSLNNTLNDGHNAGHNDSPNQEIPCVKGQKGESTEVTFNVTEQNVDNNNVAEVAELEDKANIKVAQAADQEGDTQVTNLALEMDAQSVTQDATVSQDNTLAQGDSLALENAVVQENTKVQANTEVQEVEAYAVDAVAEASDTASLLDFRVPMAQLNAMYFTQQKLGESVLDHENEKLRKSESLRKIENLRKKEKQSDKDESKSIFYSSIFEQRILSSRLIDSQKSHFIFIEVLQTVVGFDANSTSSDIWINEHGQCYCLYIRHVLLRRLLYNNPFLEFFNSRQLSDEEKWQQWMDSFIKISVREKEVNNNKTFFVRQSLIGLKDNFQDFSAFTKAITLLRSWSFSAGQLWSLRFLFPFGPDCLYPETKTNHSKNNSLLIGAGQLVFLMMVRANEDDIFKTVCYKLHQRFLDPNNVLNSFARDLQGFASQKVYERFRKANQQHSFDDFARFIEEFETHAQSHDPSLSNEFLVIPSQVLPYKTHRVYGQMLHDFYNVLTLKHELNQRELFFALALICNLNLLMYYLEVSKTVLCFACDFDECNIDIVVECNHTPGRHIRSLADLRFNANAQLMEQAVRSMLNRYLLDMFPKITQDTQFTVAEFDKLLVILKDSFNLTQNSSKNFDFESCLKYSMVDEKSTDKEGREPTVSFKAISRCLGDSVCYRLAGFLKVHRSFAIDIGLASKFKTRAYRYTLSDELVRVLVLTTVTHGKQLMLLDDFLECLYQKYHIVIGTKQAERYNMSKNLLAQNVEESRLADNLKAFKEQLSRLGFLISLSDTASYVKNPYLG